MKIIHVEEAGAGGRYMDSFSELHMFVILRKFFFFNSKYLWSYLRIGFTLKEFLNILQM